MRPNTMAATRGSSSGGGGSFYTEDNNGNGNNNNRSVSLRVMAMFGAGLLLCASSLYVSFQVSFGGSGHIPYKALHDSVTHEHLLLSTTDKKKKKKKTTKTTTDDGKEADTEPFTVLSPDKSHNSLRSIFSQKTARLETDATEAAEGEDTTTTKSADHDASSATENTDSNEEEEEEEEEVKPPESDAANDDKKNDEKTKQQDSDSENNNGDRSNKKQPMNIVLFYADDWTFRTLGLINKNVKTPNLDEMARRGMLFRYNCVTTSICWQSRATLVSGRYVSVHKHVFISSESMFNQTLQWPDTLYPLLKTQGYHVGYVGKWHAPMPGEFREYTWDYQNLYYGDHWMDRNGKRRHVTDLNGEDALHYLREVRPKDQHFALTIAFFATHSWDEKKYPDQYMPQNRTEPLYRNATIPTPKTATEKHWKDLPFFFDDGNEARYRWRLRYDTPEHFQVTMKRYYRMATEVDDVVGDVISELKAQGVYNNTMLIFTTDNGMFHGEHGLAGKWYPHEESVRVPLIIQDPRMPENQVGRFNDEFTLNIDLAPTILSAAGSPVPPGMQGRDIAQLYLDPEAASKSWRKDFFFEWNYGGDNKNARGHDFDHIPAVFALVRKDYKYFYWPRDKYEQIFHIEKDPFEEFDIFNSTAQSNADQYKELKSRYAHLKDISQSGHSV